MEQASVNNIEAFLEQSNEAYNLLSTFGNINTDFADFASLSVSEFQSLMKRPTMTKRQLRRLLRRGCHSHRHNAPESSWASYLAGYISDTANADLFD